VFLAVLVLIEERLDVRIQVPARLLVEKVRSAEYLQRRFLGLRGLGLRKARTWRLRGIGAVSE